MIEKKPFRKYNLDEDNIKKPLALKLNPEQWKLLEECKVIMNQSKNSTALKQLAWIGAEELLSKKTSRLISIIQNNKRKNKRIGVIDFED